MSGLMNEWGGRPARLSATPKDPHFRRFRAEGGQDARPTQDMLCSLGGGLRLSGACDQVQGRPAPLFLQEKACRLAYDALIREVELTPKPGLVDRRNTGAHRDMTLASFEDSAAAIRPWFHVFFMRGLASANRPADQILPLLRPDGIACERAMLAATKGVNTHKGAIFAFGLLLGAIGRHVGQGRAIGWQSVCAEIALFCRHLVDAELAQGHRPATAGERQFHQYGLTGARGEAASGFATVTTAALPAFLATEDETGDEQTALFAAFLELLAVNPDSNLVARGGLEGLAFVQTEARRLKAEGGVHHPDFMARMAALDDVLIERNLSPGGSADLLAVTWFLARIADFHLQDDNILT